MGVDCARRELPSPATLRDQRTLAHATVVPNIGSVGYCARYDRPTPVTLVAGPEL